VDQFKKAVPRNLSSQQASQYVEKSCARFWGALRVFQISGSNLSHTACAKQ
jgi:hypothetical protein